MTSKAPNAESRPLAHARAPGKRPGGEPGRRGWRLPGAGMMLLFCLFTLVGLGCECDEDDCSCVRPDVTAPADDFSRFVGESTSGFWTLNVADDYTPHVGQLEDWALYLSY